MCGRTCLTLDPKQILNACKYKSAKPKIESQDLSTVPDIKILNETRSVDENYLIPEWRAEFNCGKKYEPSYNIAPTDITPVLVSSAYFGSDEINENKRVVVPMMWGMIPFWHRGDYRKHGLTTNNCRLEHMLESKLYRGPFRKGQRCVILCEGFYEWQTVISAKPSERAVHLLYMPQQDGILIYDKSTWNPDNINLMKLAGLFDVWDDENGDKIFSYSVITFESTNILSWLHHRMPAILETDDQVNHWLHYKEVSDKQALSALRPATILKWHQVTNDVNSTRNKSDICNKPVDVCRSLKAIGRPKSKIMQSWLIVRKRREEVLAETAALSDEDSDRSAVDGVPTSSATTSESELENQAKRCKYRSLKKTFKSKD